jgi:hypothetical protein
MAGGIALVFGGAAAGTAIVESGVITAAHSFWLTTGGGTITLLACAELCGNMPARGLAFDAGKAYEAGGGKWGVNVGRLLELADEHNVELPINSIMDAGERAEQYDVSRGVIPGDVGSAVHDFNNKLQAIQGWVELGRQTRVDAAIEDLMQFARGIPKTR